MMSLMHILEVLHKTRSILVTWNECSWEARVVKQTFGAHRLVCYQGKVVFLYAPRHFHHMGQRPASKTPIPWYKFKKLRQIHPKCCLTIIMGLLYMDANSATSLSLIPETAMQNATLFCLCKISHNSPTPTTHFIWWRRRGKCNSHFFNWICRLDIKEVGNMCLMTSGYVCACK